ncbi:mitochondrion protein [Melanogaster broomeanus]|nr:mitochondrion protein [Melanogaster broomeanus]
MKIGLSDEELKEHRAVTIRGALEGALASTAIVIPTFYLLNKRWSYFRSLPPPLKLLGGVIIVTPLISFGAEERGLEYDRQHWTGVGKTELERRSQLELERWASLGPKDKVAHWAAKHQLSVIMGSWATSMAVAGSIIMRDPLLTMPQKVVQVRLWAQGLTIGVLIATAALTHAQRQEAAEMRRHGGDHSWLYAIEALQKEQHAK